MIPTIDVRSLAAKGAEEGELVFEFEPSGDLIDIPYTSFASPARAKLRYKIFEDDAVEVSGTVEFVLKGACSRCLEPARQSVTGNVYGFFEPGDGDGETYGYRRTVVLEELLKDSLLFAMPSRLLCGNCGDFEE